MNQGVLNIESQEFKDYDRKRKRNELSSNAPYPENISDVSPSAVLSLSLFIALLKKENILHIKAPIFLPLRWQAHERLGKTEQERIQENMTDKFLRTFRRIAYHLPDIKIDYPKNSGQYLQVTLNKQQLNNTNNAILNESLRLV